MLYRFTERIVEAEIVVAEDFTLDNFQDSGDISRWAEPYLRWANYHGLIQGIDAVTLRPGGNTTRAQCATILMRYVEAFITQEFYTEINPTLLALHLAGEGR